MKASRKLHSSLAASRRGFFGCAGAVTTSALLQVRPISAADVVEAPRDWGLAGKDYATESLKVIGHMRYCINQEKGAPNMELYNKNMKKEMTDFSSFYLANTKKGPGINDLRTDVSILATFYTNAGFTNPVKPDMRDKLLSSLKDIEDLIVASQTAAVSPAPPPDPPADPATRKRKDGGSAYGNDDSAKSAAMQQRLLDNNPDAFKSGGFKVSF